MTPGRPAAGVKKVLLFVAWPPFAVLLLLFLAVLFVAVWPAIPPFGRFDSNNRLTFGAKNERPYARN